MATGTSVCVTAGSKEPTDSIRIAQGCSLMLSDYGLEVFDLPRSLFDQLPGMEFERSDAGNGQRFYVRHGAISGAMQITFYCEQPPITTAN